MPRKVFTAGEILTAADVNTNLMDQAVMVFDDSGARGSAIPSPSEGMVTYLKDTDAIEKFNGSAFVPVGTILQVVSTVKTNTFSTSSTSFTSVTGLTATITPSSTSSKILVLLEMGISNSDNNDASAQWRLSGGNSGTYIGDAEGSQTRAVGGYLLEQSRFSFRFSLMAAMANFLDSPNTTSPITYGVEVRTAVGTVFVNRSGNQDSGTASAMTRGASSITVMEVAG